ncbi:DUF3784 domain-containing protein [Clostridium sp. LIBA-8841]|uniref:DUF3784 domain-containing protein n=1 Tax=Clostridium sp. LIBA-8841 TaxID=2987530 RepID=UPI002AC4FE4B|nr:DUF3784 domain-containing protein [Clostridium sp. LIBA-8841]MDZ5252621.1 DUF3784 domain-containing protein [Clostridium sp. LIBA-8841]
MIMYFLASILLWGLAIVIGSGKANFLIAGYNTASKEEKEKIDKKKLSRFMGKFLFILGAIQLILPITEILKIEYDGLVFSVSVIFILVTLGGVIYMNTGDRFKK